MNESIIQQIYQTIQSFGFHAEIEEGSEEFPMQQLFIPLAKDHQDREIIAQINYIEQQMQATVSRDLSVGFLHFFTALPFQIPQDKFAEISRLTCLVNKVIALPGFGLSETDQAVTYHYVLPITSSHKPEIIQFILTNMIHIFDLFLNSFEDIAQNKLTYESLVNAAIEQSQNVL